MGRPTVFKKGAMTAAERQRRRRAKIRKERRQAEQAQSQERSVARLNDPERLRRKSEADRQQSERHDAKHQEWLARYGREPLPGATGPADELARQIEEYLAENSGITIADVRAAIDRRFGPAAG